MRKHLSYCLIAASVLFTSCGGEQAATDQLAVKDTDSTQQQERMKKTQKIFYSIPSPMETAKLLKDAGAQYDKDILNDVLNVDKYTAPSKQALNLGVYGADLSYASVFNNTQESMYYTSCAQKLAKRLDVSNAFNEDVVDRMEKNRNERDSLLTIISETYWDVDAYLKDAGRENISALMIAGGWVEGLYIATQVSKANDSPALRTRIAEQRFSLKDLISLLGTYDPTDQAVAGALADLKSLSASFAGVGGEAPTTQTKQDNGVTVIGGGGGGTTMDDKQLAAIRDRAAIVRNSYIAN